MFLHWADVHDTNDLIVIVFLDLFITPFENKLHTGLDHDLTVVSDWKIRDAFWTRLTYN